jgi:hypothetical protein
MVVLVLASERLPEVAERFSEGEGGLGGKPSVQSPVEGSGALPSEHTDGNDDDCCACSPGVMVVLVLASERLPETAERFPEVVVLASVKG